MEDKRPQWSSNISFIIATVGSAVGLGNIWRFPYIMGKYGGAVFLLTYLLLIAFICVIPLSIEMLLGKIYKSNIVDIYAEINSKFKIFGWIAFITTILIPSFYFVVGGWILHYIIIFSTNNLPNNFVDYFSSYSTQTFMPVTLTLLFLFLNAIFPFRGLKNGIEKANNVMMPLFFIILLILAGYALSLPNAIEGLNFMFKPDFSLFNKNTLMIALGQALFTLSIGMGAIFTYGSYLKNDTNIIKSSYILIVCDTLVAVISGIIIFPIVFSYGVEPAVGAKLIFISIPQIFTSIPYSQIIAVLFFVLLFFTAITTGISMMEASILALIDKYNFSRKKATISITLLIAIFSTLATLSFGILNNIKIFSMTIFDFLDYLTSNILLPFNTLILCILAGWFIKNVYQNEFNKHKKLSKLFCFMLKFILPIFLALVLISGICP